MKAKDLIKIEKRLTRIISKAWMIQNKSKLAKISVFLKNKDFDSAHEMAGTLEKVNLNRKFKALKAQIILLMLHGARNLGKPDEIKAVIKQDEIVLITKSLISSMGTFHKVFIKNLRNAIEREESFTKSDVSHPAGEYLKGAVNHGNVLVNYAVALHSTRVSAYGFVSMASLTGISHYEIDEQLDNRICPVCRMMDGNSFKVDDVKDHLKHIVGVTDPDILKELAPWPKQDPKSLLELSTMTREELLNRGLASPPFHPLCRGLLKETKEKPEEVDLESIPNPKANGEFIKELGIPSAGFSSEELIGVVREFVHGNSVPVVLGLEEALLSAILDILDGGYTVDEAISRSDFLQSLINSGRGQEVYKALEKFL